MRKLIDAALVYDDEMPPSRQPPGGAFIDGAKWIVDLAKQLAICTGHPTQDCKCAGKVVRLSDLEQLIEGENDSIES